MAGAQIATQPQQPSPREMSFQRMLELEKKYKTQRSRSNSIQQGEPPVMEHSLDGRLMSPSFVTETRSSNADLPTPQSIGRNGTHPPLCVTIPTRSSAGRDSAAVGMIPEPLKVQKATSGGTNEPQPVQKTVKFLTPENDSEDDSDQSSICQSPSWEGYGQKKKERKREAERKRKEKEQAEKEAKAARKRPTARLSKPPPAKVLQLSMLTQGSNSAPSLGGHWFSAHESRSSKRQIHSSSSRGNSPSHDRETPSSPNRRLFGRSDPDHLEESARRNHKQATDSTFPSDILAKEHTQEAQEPTRNTDLTSSSTQPIPGSQRTHCPPSASRTPQLRYMTADRAHSRTRGLSQSLDEPSRGRGQNDEQPSTGYLNPSYLQGHPNATDSPRDKNRPDHGYVRRQRDRSTERAMASFAYEQFSSSIDVVSHSPARNSLQGVRQPPHVASDDKPSVAKVANQSNGATAAELLGRADKPRSAVADQSPSPLSKDFPRAVRDHSSKIALPGCSGSAHGRSHSAVLNYPLEQRPRSHRRSLSDSGSGRLRDLKNAAMAALQRPSRPPKAAKVPPPCPAFSPPVTSPVQLTQTPAAHEVPRSAKATHGDSGKSSIPFQQNGSQASIDSSSSSKYSVNSDTTSPATTPDTSRPQSQKSPPSTAVGDLGVPIGNSPVQTDRHASFRPSATTNPQGTCFGKDVTRLIGSDEGTTENDMWSSADTPVDTECDTRSTVTLASNCEEDNASKRCIRHPATGTSSAEWNGSRAPDEPAGLPRENCEPHPLPDSPKDDLIGQAKGRVFLLSPRREPRIPPRSEARNRPGGRPKTSVAETRPGAAETGPEESPQNQARDIPEQQRRPREQTLGPEDMPVTMARGGLERNPAMLDDSTGKQPTVLDSSAAPIAKVLVQCCSCRFFHDMPPKLYECMVKPNSLFEDRSLGISGAITTMVKCPWCQHNMSTGCCSVYGAEIHLMQKLH